MLLLKDRLAKIPIMSLQTGAKIAETAQPIIDPRQLRIVALYCEGPRLDFHPAVLHVDDIREVGALGIIVDSADNLMSPEDLVRLQEVINFNFQLVGKRVKEDTGRKVGQVVDFAVDLDSFFVTKLYVQPSFLESLQMLQVIIGRSQVIEVNDKEIVVRSATVEQKNASVAESLAVKA